MSREMSRRERLLAVLEGRPTDRVPVVAGHFNEWRDDWKSGQPSYHNLVRFCREHCDGVLSWAARPVNETAPGTSSTEAEVRREEHSLADGGTETVSVLKTPGGELTQRQRRLPGAGTVWTVEHYLKTQADWEALLSVPPEPLSFDISGFDEADRRIGEAGLVLCEMGDAICMVASVCGMEMYTVMAMIEPDLFTRLLDRFHQAAIDQLKANLSAGPVRFVRIYGPEYASPPYLPPELFDRYVAAYDRELIDLAHQHGAFVRLHCHGRVRDLLPRFVRMGADATDPVEPPPMGDVTLAEAKGIVGDKLTIFGNLELRDLETLSRDEVVALTRRTLDEGMPGGRFAVQPDAEPITIPLNPKLEENWMAYIETVLKHGRYH